MLENKETLWCVYCPCSHFFLSPYLSGKRNNNNKKKRDTAAKRGVHLAATLLLKALLTDSSGPRSSDQEP